MSNLLERAIVDAKALREAALRNAEQLVIEKYSKEIKETMSDLLEQEDPLADLGAEDPMAGLGDVDPLADPAAAPTDAAAEGEQAKLNPEDLLAQTPSAFDTDEDEIIQIKLDSLDADIEDELDGPFAGNDELGDDEVGIDIQTDDEIEAMAEPDIDMDMGADSGVGIDITPETLEEIISDALQDILSEDEEELEEDIGENNEELEEEIDLDELMERVRVEGQPQKSGWAGTPESIMKEYESMLLAREQDSEVKEENEELRKNVAALQKENKTLSSAAVKLQEQNKEYNTAFKTLQEKLETMNVSNAKLLYINQALENASLNERQKRKIVEAISKAETVQEAKIVFETMNDTVVTTSDVKRETTLSEMVSKKSSLLVAARKEQPKQDANPMYNRMQKLAGIKTN
jgi:hypothetical protein